MRGGNTKNSSNFDGMVPGPEVGVLLIDEKRKIVTANDVSAAIFGTPDLAGKEITALLKGGLQNEFGRTLQQKFQAGKGTHRFSFEVTGNCKGGTTFPASVILTRNSVGNKTWWTALFRKLEDEGEIQKHSPDEILQGATDELQKHCLSMVEETTTYREELENLQKERDDLSSLLQATQAAVGDLEKKVAEQTSLNGDLEKKLSEAQKKLDDAENGTALKERDFENEVAQNERLKEELMALRQMCDDLTEKLAAEQMAASESAKLLEDWNHKLEEAAQVESEWQAKLEAASAELEEIKSNQAEEEKKARDTEAELEGLRHTLQDLEGKHAAEQLAVATANQKQEELEAALQEKSDALENANRELEQLRAEGGQEEWLKDLRRLREAEASFESDRVNLEHRLRESVSSLARATAELERERKERRRNEQRTSSLTSQLQEMHEELKRHLEAERSTQDRIYELEEQLREQQETSDRLRIELSDEEAGRQLAEEQINLAEDMKSQADNYRVLFEESKETFKRAREELDSKLQHAMQSANDLEAKLRQESSERQRSEETLASLQEKHDRMALDLSRIESELQVERLERKQLEGEAAQSRYATLDSARVNRAQASTLKRQLRQPVDALLQSTRQLLDAELPETERKVVEDLLENSLLVQACLQEGSSSSTQASGTTQEDVAGGTGDSPNVNQAA